MLTLCEEPSFSSYKRMYNKMSSVHGSSVIATDVPMMKIIFLTAKRLQEFKAAASELSYCIITFVRVGWERRRGKEEF